MTNINMGGWPVLPPCTSCGSALSVDYRRRTGGHRPVDPGTRRHSGHNMCESCSRRHRRTANEPPPPNRFNRPSWMRDAACAGVPTVNGLDVFFPDLKTYREATPLAREVCGWCPVAQACLTYSLDNDIQEGIWGGLNEHQRRDLWRARRRREVA